MLEVGKQAAEAKIQLTVLGRTQPVEVQLAKLRVRGEKIITNRPPDWRGIRVDHATAVEGFQTQVRMGSVDMKGCVAVIEVERDSVAWQAGLRPKMFISHVGSRRVGRPQEFREAVAALDGAVRVRLTLPENQTPTADDSCQPHSSLLWRESLPPTRSHWSLSRAEAIMSGFPNGLRT